MYLTGSANSNLSHDNTTGVFVQIRRVDDTDPMAAPVEVVGVQFRNTNGGGDGRVNRIPPSAVWAIDFPPAGTYTYEVWLSRNHNERAETQGVRLAVFEVGG